MATGLQVTLAIPDGALPGTLLSVPVRGGAESVKIRVPQGVGPGSEILLMKAEGCEDWDVQVASIVPPPEPVEQEAACSSQVSPPAGPPPSRQQPEPEPTRRLPPPDAPAPPEVPGPGPTMGGEGALAYTVRLETTVGAIDIIVRPDWSPHGTRRFLELAAAGDLNELAFYRAIKGCIVQFGLPPKRIWPPIPDDPPTGVPFLLGAVSFAAVGENTRKSTLFICVGDMSHCLGQNSWETPIGAVAETSLDVLDSIETRYGDIAEFNGPGPDTSRINSEGAPYLRENFPMLSYIARAYPLDWQPPQDLRLPPLNQALQQPTAQTATDPAVIAARAAEDAQLKAMQATQAAARVQQASHPDEMREAAQVAREAAEAAKVAALQAAQAAERAEAAKAAQMAETQKAERVEQAVQQALKVQQQQVQELQLREAQQQQQLQQQQRQLFEAQVREDALTRSARASPTSIGMDRKYIMPSETLVELGQFRSPVDVPVEIKTPSWVPPLNGPATTPTAINSQVGRHMASGPQCGNSVIFRSTAPPLVGAGMVPNTTLRSVTQAPALPPMVGASPICGSAIAPPLVAPPVPNAGFRHSGAMLAPPYAAAGCVQKSQAVVPNVMPHMLRR
mmetsp:Transcript_18727/g.33891  ORF Transcript_18727/g.33891 Transcript_18727/m.33891 type:complete len:620 (+) Transcript_18727:142-2001(+)